MKITSKNLPKKLRILLPIRYPVGGIRTYIKYTHGRLDRESFDFTIVGPSSLWLNQIKRDLGGCVNVVCTAPEDNSLSLLKGIFVTLAKEEYDLIHSQGYTAGIMSVVANFFFRLPHIITLHRTFGDGQLINEFWKSQTFLKRRIIEYLIGKASVIQPVSIDAKENLLQFFPRLRRKNTKIVVIRNGICIEQFRRVDIDADFRDSIGARDHFLIGFFGRYMPEKGFSYLIEAVDSLVNKHGVKNLKVLSVGGFGGFIREYKKQISQRGLKEYFAFLGFAENIAPILKQIDLIVIPSLGEACPLLPMEALVCGVPIVAFNCIGLREILSGTPAIMVPVADDEKLATAILQVQKIHGEVKTRFTEYVGQACRRYDSRKTAKCLELLYRRCIIG